MARVFSWLLRPGLLWSLVGQARLTWRLVREPRVPHITKAIPLAAALYVLFPIDVLPDVIPLLGQIDDLALVVAAVQVFLRLAPVTAVAFHRGAIAGRRRYAPMSPADTMIDAEWRHG